MAPACVITTINGPTKAVRELAARFPSRLMVVGDRKTPEGWSHSGAEFVSHGAQRGLRLRLPRRLPDDHYARKNIGYLLAMQAGASCIYDTDDDNIPNRAWRLRDETCRAESVSQPGWCNAYRLFHSARMWPRGLPLDRVNDPVQKVTKSSVLRSPVQQGLADGNPDVDAVWRLVMPRAISFRKWRSVALDPGAWCPFNSQSTWWWPSAYALMYLPVNVTFRMTDIWRSLVAQRCLWEMDAKVVFHSPAEVVQVRNPHDLMADFKDEIPGYLNNQKIVDVLAGTKLRRGRAATGSNLLACYAALAEAAIVPSKELEIVDAWLADIDATVGSPRP